MTALHAMPARFDRAAQHRRSLIAKIHVAKKQLVMAEDDYRQILFDETGRGSLKDCDVRELEKVVRRLQGIGFTPVPKAGRKGVAMHPMARKARALWISLHHLNVVKNPAEEALEAFAARQLGCERLIWARQGDAFRLIEALKDMAARNGWAQPAKASVTQLQEGLCMAILAKLQVAAIVPGDWSIDIAAWRLCGIETAKPGGFTADDYSGLAKALGDKLRSAGGGA